MKFNILIAVALLLSCNSQKSDNTKGSKSQELTVDAVVVTPRMLNHSFAFNGSVYANEAVDIRPEVQGRIVRIGFAEGERVEKGALLIKINDNDLQAQLKKILLQTELAVKEESRKRELLAIKGVSQEEYDIVLNKQNSLVAEKELLSAQIAKTEIRAPFSGIAGLRTVSEGAYVPAGTVITTLQQTNPVKIDFSIPERYASMMKINSEVSFSTDASDKPLKAKIYAWEPRIDMATRSIRLRAIAANSDGSLMPGAFVKIGIDFSKNIRSIVIPAKAIIPVLDGEKVFVIKNAAAVSRKVVTGLRTSSEVEITSGLNADDTLIVSGLLMLKEGMKVKARVVEPSIPAAQ